jgi:dsRNA-specific ribonuclease
MCLMSTGALLQLRKILNHTFTTHWLCAEALQMAAPLHFMNIKGQPRMVDKNTRLAVLGDAVLDCTLCKMWYNAKDSSGEHI